MNHALGVLEDQCSLASVRELFYGCRSLSAMAMLHGWSAHPRSDRLARLEEDLLRSSRAELRPRP